MIVVFMLVSCLCNCLGECMCLIVLVCSLICCFSCVSVLGNRGCDIYILYCLVILVFVGRDECGLIRELVVVLV